MKKPFVSLAVISLVATPALAESCSKSRDYILEGLAGDLSRPGSTYQALFKDCLEVLTFPNVKDAYVLKDGGIAIDARRTGLAATASTLARFCERFPSGTARFFTQREKATPRTVGLVVMMSSAGAIPCTKIRGDD
jgi:hypothetical protein